MLRGAGEIGVAEDVSGAVDARPFTVPEPEHAIELALAAQLGLLRAPDRGGGDVLVDTGLEQDVVFVERALGANELQVEGAERRSAIARHITRGVEAGTAVALLLHQTEAHDGLKAGDEDPALGQIVFVVERDVVERHRARLRGIVGLRGTRAAGIFDSFQGYKPSGRGSNAKKLRSLAISRRAPPRQRSFGASARYAFWRNAAQRFACSADIAPMP